MRILITGTPGTGKTVLSKKLSKLLKFGHLNWTEFVKKNKLYESYDRKNKCYIVDGNYVADRITKATKTNDWVIDTHMGYFFKKKDIALCIVTYTALKELSKRLKKRKYPAQKIKDNLESEAFQDIYLKCVKKKYKIIYLDTTKGYNIKKIISAVKKLNK